MKAKVKNIVSFVTLLGCLLPLSSCGGDDTTPASNSSGSGAKPEEMTVQMTSPTKGDGALATKLRVFFYRFDEKYENDQLWMWPEKGDGGQFKFKKQVSLNHADKGTWYYSEVDLTKSYDTTGWDGSGSFNVDFGGRQAQRVGVIPRTKVGGAKDDDFDRFIDLSYVQASGTVDAFVLEGTTEVFYGLSNVPEGATKGCGFTSFDGIKIESYKPFTDDSRDKSKVHIKDSTGKEYPIEKISKLNDYSSQIYLKDSLPIDAISQKFTYTHDDGSSAPIKVDGLYSTSKFISECTTNEKLGVIYSKTSSTFKIWSPIAKSIKLNVYEDAKTTTKLTYPMAKGAKGVFTHDLAGDLHGKYYTYDVELNDVTNYDVADPYALSSNANGERSMVVDMGRTNPEGWDAVTQPTSAQFNDPIVYETHVRDFTMGDSWNGPAEHKGKFLGLADTGTTSNSKATGFDYVKELGVTHLQLMPIFDFKSVDETKLKDPAYQKKDYGGIYNWGYDPLSYNSLEGSYSSNPDDGLTRIKEFKQVVKAYNNADIGIIMDVVYNHMPGVSGSTFDKIMPNYYFRGTNASGAGADMASERKMYHNFMVQSTEMWATEYKLSGFRFDLMGLHDVDTMNDIAETIRGTKDAPKDSDFIIYGEGWNMGSHSNPANQSNVTKMDNIGVFNDVFRDGVKGSVFNDTEGGWIQEGSVATRGKVNSGIYGGEDSWKKTNGSNVGVSVNYVEAHDNLTLHDKLKLSKPNATEAEVLKLATVANSILMTSQGLAFMHAGQEFGRSKLIPTDMEKTGEASCNADKSVCYSHNSYNTSDRVNAIDWSLVNTNSSMVEAVKSTIALRKEHRVFKTSSFRASSPDDDLNERIKMLFSKDPTILAYEIRKEVGTNETNEFTLVIHNVDTTSKTLDLTSEFTMLFDGTKKVSNGTKSNSVTIAPYSSLILYR